MLQIKRSDLYYKDYSWKTTEGDNPRLRGEPDRSLLNRNEGFEILYFVNKFLEKHSSSLKRMESAHKVEKMIRNELPSDVRHQINVQAWIEANWNRSRY